eukprot:g6171.t1
MVRMIMILVACAHTTVVNAKHYAACSIQPAGSYEILQGRCKDGKAVEPVLIVDPENCVDPQGLGSYQRKVCDADGKLNITTYSTSDCTGNPTAQNPLIQQDCSNSMFFLKCEKLLKPTERWTVAACGSNKKLSSFSTSICVEHKLSVNCRGGGEPTANVFTRVKGFEGSFQKTCDGVVALQQPFGKSSFCTAKQCEEGKLTTEHCICGGDQCTEGQLCQNGSCTYPKCEGTSTSKGNCLCGQGHLAEGFTTVCAQGGKCEDNGAGKKSYCSYDNCKDQEKGEKTCICLGGVGLSKKGDSLLCRPGLLCIEGKADGETGTDAKCEATKGGK